MEDRLEARVERLERENRNLRCGGFVALVLVVVAVLMGQASLPKVSDQVRTRQLLVVDDSGNLQAALQALKDGPVLSFYDEAGKVRMAIASSKYKEAIEFNDESGKTRVSLRASKDEASLHFLNGKGKHVAALETWDIGSLLSLYDQEGKMRAGISCLTAGGETALGLGFYNEQGIMRAGLSDEGDGPCLELLDSQGYKASLGVSNLITPKTGATTKRSAASLIMFDKEKNVIWQAP